MEPLGHAVFKTELGNLKRAEELLGKDDPVSRQSITTRAGSVFGMDAKAGYIHIEGHASAIARAEEILKEGSLGTRLTGAEADEVHRKVRAEAEMAEAGFGSVFGD